MSKIFSNKKDDSLAHINNDDQIQIAQMPSLKNKIATKLEANKHFSCLHVYNNTLYLGTRNSKLYIYNISVSQQGNQQNDDQNFNLSSQKMITPHCEVVSLVKANDKYFVTVPQSDQQSFITVWEATSRMFITVLKGHKSQVSQIIFMKNDKYMISSSWDCTIKIWSLGDLQRDQSIKTFTGNYPILQVKEFNDEILVFGGDDCYLVFWNWKKQQVIKKEFGHAGSVTYIQVMGSAVVTAGGDNKFKVWDVTQNQKQQPSKEEDFKNKYIIKKVQQHKQQYDSIIFGTLIGDDLLLMDRQGQMFLFTQNKEIHRLTNHFQYNQNVTGIQIFGDYLLVTTTKGCLKHFNIKQERDKVGKFYIQQEEGEAKKSNKVKVSPSSDDGDLQQKNKNIK